MSPVTLAMYINRDPSTHINWRLEDSFHYYVIEENANDIELPGFNTDRAKFHTKLRSLTVIYHLFVTYMLHDVSNVFFNTAVYTTVVGKEMALDEIVIGRKQ